MEKYPNRKTTRLPGYDYSTPGTYFLTICTENKHCLLSFIVGTGVLDGPAIKLLPYGKIADKYINQLNDFYDNISVKSYVIMPNHIHILLSVKDDGPSRTPVPTNDNTSASGPSGRPVSTNDNASASGPSRTPVPTAQNSIVSRFVSTFKRFCNKEYGKNIWQSRSYDHIIRDQADFDKHLQYIYENPFAWQKDEFYAEEQ